MHISPQTAFLYCNDRIQTHFIIISVDMHQPASAKYTNTQKASRATFSLHSCTFSNFLNQQVIMFPRWCNFLTSIQCKQTKSTQIKNPKSLFMKILSHLGCRIFKQGESQLFAKNFTCFATYARGTTIYSKRRKGS